MTKNIRVFECQSGHKTQVREKDYAILVKVGGPLRCGKCSAILCWPKQEMKRDKP